LNAFERKVRAPLTLPGMRVACLWKCHRQEL
jgi:hypothetical protein